MISAELERWSVLKGAEKQFSTRMLNPIAWNVLIAKSNAATDVAWNCQCQRWTITRQTTASRELSSAQSAPRKCVLKMSKSTCAMSAKRHKVLSSRCQQLVIRGKRATHERRCPMRIVQCSLGCGYETREKDIHLHENYQCLRRFQESKQNARAGTSSSSSPFRLHSGTSSSEWSYSSQSSTATLPDISTPQARKAKKKVAATLLPIF